VVSTQSTTRYGQEIFFFFFFFEGPNKRGEQEVAEWSAEPSESEALGGGGGGAVIGARAGVGGAVGWRQSWGMRGEGSALS
jgi:hypothetical protein